MRRRMIRRAKELTAYRTAYVVETSSGERKYRLSKGKLEVGDKVLETYKTRMGAWCW